MKNSSKCNFIDYLRKPKLANISVFDVVATFAVAVLIGYLVNKKHPFKIHLWINIIIIFLLLIILAIIVHKILKIPTMLNYYIGINTLESVMKNRKNC
jgi:uncharacterized membrane protein YcaP (DUF421 family)